MKFIKFPDIEQFRTIIRDVQHSYQYQGKDADGNPIMDRNAKMPILRFVGTTKIHGTNAAVCYCPSTDELWAQKRSDVCTLQNDNAGFAFFVESRKDAFKDLFVDFKGVDGDILTLYGEWCGGNIQKGVAVSQLKEKIFVIFDMKITPVEGDAIWAHDFLWKDLYFNVNRIYNIYQFGHWNVDIDFANPAMSQNALIELTEAVEKECPVGKFFGFSGIGEGIVWKHESPKMGTIRFKVKGEKHASSKVTTLAPVDVEKLTKIDDFVNYAVTDNRFNQAIEQVFTSNNTEPDIRKMGDYIRWIVNDVVKEESDVMIENGLEPKEVNKLISDKARRWFMEKYVNV